MEYPSSEDNCWAIASMCSFKCALGSSVAVNEAVEVEELRTQGFDAPIESLAMSKIEELDGWIIDCSGT